MRPYPLALSALTVAALAFSGCEVGPDYHRPAVETPPAFLENGPWKAGQPQDTQARGDWWQIFGDPALDGLEKEATAANPSVKAALARVEEARAVARVGMAALLPNVGVNGVAARTRYSQNRQLPPGSPHVAYTTNSIDLPLDLSYEIDLFGQVRRALEGARALADAQQDAYQSVLLSLQAEAAEEYFTLRGLLQEKAYLDSTVEGRRRELDLVGQRQKAGASDSLDVLRARAELDTVESAELATDRQIAEVRHALAVLAGRTPEGYSIEVAPLAGDPPAVPVGIPSDLLERRPDVAQAERTLAAANAAIGVAKASFFPSINLTAFAGTNSAAFNTLFDGSSHEWSVAPFVSIPLFQGGRNWANYQRSKASYDEQVANYRGQVLSAFRDVDDSLSDLRYLSSQAGVLREGVTAATQAEDLSLLRYKQGVSDYFEVIDAERTKLDSQVTYAQVQTQRYLATLLLIKSLGGSWH